MGARTPVSFGKSLFIGAGVGFLLVATVVLGALVGSGTLGLPGEEPGLERVLIVAVTEDPDGSRVAGMVFLLEASGAITPVDTRETVTIPGTSYDRIRDAYAFGGGAGVAAAVGDALSRVTPPPWVVLQPESWVDALDGAGGVRYTVPEGANIYVAGDLLLIPKGEQELSGAEVHALVAAAAESDQDATALSELLGAVVRDQWDRVTDAVRSGQGDTSVDYDLLDEFGAGF